MYILSVSVQSISEYTHFHAIHFMASHMTSHETDYSDCSMGYTLSSFASDLIKDYSPLVLSKLLWVYPISHSRIKLIPLNSNYPNTLVIVSWTTFFEQTLEHTVPSYQNLTQNTHTCRTGLAEAEKVGHTNVISHDSQVGLMQPQLSITWSSTLC